MIVDVFIAGVQKSGTTSLFSYFQRHPGLSGSRVKETHHFDNEALDWSTINQDRFHAFFDRKPPGTRYFEATPIYCFWPSSLERIHRYNPQARIVLIFRDPIERAYSHWRMERLRGTEQLSFASAIREGRTRLSKDDPTGGSWRDQSYVERGFYGRMLARARSVFLPEQILCLNSMALERDHQAALASIARFLAIDDFPPVPVIREHQTPATPHLDRVRSEDHAYLREVYAEDLALFGKLSGLDTSSWWIYQDFDLGQGDCLHPGEDKRLHGVWS